MKVRQKSNPTVTGVATRFNTHGLGEIVVGFDGEDDGQDSCYISDYEVFLETTQEWKGMTEAFRDRDLIPSNANVLFAEPRDAVERQRGYY